MNIPRPEYPRPQFVRADDTYVNLNGEWDFEFDFGKSGKVRDLLHTPFSKKITVPFVVESELSGIGYTDFLNAVWYRRKFAKPEGFDTKDNRLLLHFGAVDYKCTLWLNGVEIGSHAGGYTPFTFDITENLADDNEITLYVESDSRDPMQPSGKQSNVYNNFGCMYTRCTGIWQTVWLETVPRSYVHHVKMTPDIDNGTLAVTAYFAGDPADTSLDVFASYNGEEMARTSVRANGASVTFALSLRETHLWDIGKPELYDITFTYGSDTVSSYFGMRKIAVKGNVIELNNRPVFQRLVLDQGYYPDGIYTAPDDDTLRRDVELSMKAGFNGARLHMKVFEPRLLYHADRAGYLLWGEYPNWGLETAFPAACASMLPEWICELERDYNHPAIIGWCALNETDSNRDTRTHTLPYDIAKAYDPMRPVIDVSGYYHTDKYDVYDVHDYTQDPESFKAHYDPLVTGEGEPFKNAPPAYDGKVPFFVSEFGGTRWEDITDKDGSWGYGNSPTELEEYYTRVKGLVDALLDNPKICAFCYTQLTDVYQEQNGVYRFDRSEKFDMDRIHAIFSRKAAIEK